MDVLGTQNIQKISFFSFLFVFFFKLIVPLDPNNFPELQDININIILFNSIVQAKFFTCLRVH